jgi:hypothetical protein
MSDYLITDDAMLCNHAFDRGCLEKLSVLVQSITPLEMQVDHEDEEPESISCLREVCRLHPMFDAVTQRLLNRLHSPQ